MTSVRRRRSVPRVPLTPVCVSQCLHVTLDPLAQDRTDVTHDLYSDLNKVKRR